MAKRDMTFARSRPGGLLANNLARLFATALHRPINRAGDLETAVQLAFTAEDALQCPFARPVPERRSPA
jgi:hypothetical protein